MDPTMTLIYKDGRNGINSNLKVQVRTLIQHSMYLHTSISHTQFQYQPKKHYNHGYHNNLI